jgi:hypothetical protein
MQDEFAVFKGTVHGKTIELEREPGIPDGQQVTVMLRPSSSSGGISGRLSPGKGIRRWSGAWFEDAEELDRYIESVYQRRLVIQRRDPEP